MLKKENNQHVEYRLVFNCTCSKMTLSCIHVIEIKEKRHDVKQIISAKIHC